MSPNSAMFSESVTFWVNTTRFGSPPKPKNCASRRRVSKIICSASIARVCPGPARIDPVAAEEGVHERYTGSGFGQVVEALSR